MGEHAATFGKIYGAYDLDKGKSDRFAADLKEFASLFRDLVQDSGKREAVSPTLLRPLISGSNKPPGA